MDSLSLSVWFEIKSLVPNSIILFNFYSLES